jgi:hypothetical protein
MPAIEYYNGARIWYHYDKYHRDGNKPAKIYSDGQSDWYQYGELCNVINA